MNFDWHKFWEIIEDSVIDSLELFPFLLVTYLLLEYFEHRSSKKSLNLIGKAGKSGPIAGALVGLIPQCGFAAVAANFYAARAISVGTLTAVFVATSDEMLPILISNAVAPQTILKILGLKLLFGIVIGLGLDAVWRRQAQAVNVEPLCEKEDCHCAGSGIVKPALYHSIKITLFVLIVTLFLNILLAYFGERFWHNIVFNRPIIGPMLAGIIGLIPNCSASVAITQLWIEGAINSGALIAGLSAGGGVGLLVLFRVNPDRKENIKIAIILYISAVLSGMLTEFLSVNL